MSRRDVVEVAVMDDGAGGADEEGRGLRGLADRVESLGGTLTLESPAGGGTRLRAEIPLGPGRPLPAATRPNRASA
jgi:signal transduction histidine kinase